MDTKITYSLVIPLRNEEGNIGPLLEEVKAVMDGLHSPWECLCIDDASTDNTCTIVLRHAAAHPAIKLLRLTEASGQSTALAAGFSQASGEFIITLDGDGQNNPQDIPKLIAALDGVDLVCGRRLNRKDSWSRKLVSTISNAIRRRVCRDAVNDTGCSLKLLRSACLENIKMYKGMHRFLPALFVIEGFKVIEIPVDHRQRLSGKSKYSLYNRFLAPIVDLLVVLWMRRRRICYGFNQESS